MYNAVVAGFCDHFTDVMSIGLGLNNLDSCIMWLWLICTLYLFSLEVQLSEYDFHLRHNEIFYLENSDPIAEIRFNSIAVGGTVPIGCHSEHESIFNAISGKFTTSVENTLCFLYCISVSRLPQAT